MKKLFPVFLLTFISLILVGCSTGSANEVQRMFENGAVYIGMSGTDEIIEIDSQSSWTIKNRHEDDATYSIVTVTDTGEKVDNFNIIKLVATEIMGDNMPFAKREGRSYIFAEDEAGNLYFRSISEANVEEITQELGKSEDKDAYIVSIANYRFSKQQEP